MQQQCVDIVARSVYALNNTYYEGEVKQRADPSFVHVCPSTSVWASMCNSWTTGSCGVMLCDLIRFFDLT
jgi:hypothetical protein